MSKRLFALRGAVCSLNTPEDIAARTEGLYRELLEHNRLPEEDIVSAIFSLTGDLDAMNPASTLRKAGLAGDIALFAVQEAAVRGGLPGVIRLLVHCYLEEDAVPVHVYRNGAERLRPDRAARQSGGAAEALPRQRQG